MDHYSQSERNHLTASTLDRLAEKRKDQDWVAAKRKSEDSLYIVIWQNKNLLSHEKKAHPVLLTADQAKQHGALDSSVLLGELSGKTYFALAINESTEAINSLGHWDELRWQATLLEHDEAALLIYAKAMIYWQKRNTYCGDCGYENKVQEAGQSLKCTNPDKAHMHFPRTDPAVIILIHNEDKCLLARNATWPEGNYSTIAGFVEIGESLEDTVKRESLEETGLLVNKIKYHSSQPWSFPSSLMLGYHAEALTTDINFQDDELADAIWLTRAELKARVADKTLNLPPPLAIAHNLIEAWFNEGDEGIFSDLEIDERH